MKRYGADRDNDMRKRTEPEIARPSGPLTDDEIEEIRQAYRDGCRGEVIVGMRGNERVVTMLVPAQPSENSIITKVEPAIKCLRTLSCDTYIHIKVSGIHIPIT